MLQMVGEYTLEIASAPFPREDNTVFFIASDFNMRINRFLEDNLEEIKDIFKKECLEFVYMPTTLDGDINGMPIGPSLCRGRLSRPTRNGFSFEAYHLDLSRLTDEESMLHQFKHVAEIYSRRNSIRYQEVSEDPEIVDLLYGMERIARALKMKGVKPDVFEEMMQSLEKPSTMIISGRGDISLPDFGNVKIKLNPVEKTLYIFMLKHPEGVLPDALVGFRRELLNIYRRHTIFDNEEAIEMSLDSLLSEDKTVLYSNVSRIKNKFSEKLGSRIASKYVIARDGNGAYKIAVPQHCIAWSDHP